MYSTLNTLQLPTIIPQRTQVISEVRLDHLPHDLSLLKPASASDPMMPTIAFMLCSTTPFKLLGRDLISNYTVNILQWSKGLTFDIWTPCPPPPILPSASFHKLLKFSWTLTAPQAPATPHIQDMFIHISDALWDKGMTDVGHIWEAEPLERI